MLKKLFCLNLLVIFIFVIGLACLEVSFLNFEIIKQRKFSSTITDFSTTYTAILENLMAPDHFMWQSQPGDFKGDWTGDAGAFSPHVLFISGYTDQAKLVMDYVRSLELTSSSISTRMKRYTLFKHRNLTSPTGELTPYRTSNIVDFIVGFGSYYNGPTYYKEACNWCASIGLGVTGGSVVAKADPNPLGDINGYIAGLASVANTAFVGAHTCLNPNLLNTGLSLLTQLNTQYWDETKGYYVDLNPTHQGGVEFSAFQNGTALWALTWAYGIRHDDIILNKINRLYTNAQSYLWDTDRWGVYDFKADVPLGKDLGANLLWCRGLLWAYWVTGDIRFLVMSEQILHFINNDLVVNDSSHPGFKIAAHDWYYTRGASSNYCTGCNFLLLECIWLFNELSVNGPLEGNIPVSASPGCSSKIAGN